MLRSSWEDALYDIKCRIDFPYGPVKRLIDLDVCYVKIERPALGGGFNDRVPSWRHAGDVFEVFHRDNVSTAISKNNGDFIRGVLRSEIDRWYLVDGPCGPGILQVLENAGI